MKLFSPRFIHFMLAFGGILGQSQAQNLPNSMYLSPAEHMLYTNGQTTGGLYDESQIRVYELWFAQSNYWQQLTTNYATHTDIPATLIVEGDTFPDVGVRFKGQTSFSQSGNSQKKSFNITLDYIHPDQQVMGYKTLNLNNSFQDPSFMREMVYLHQIRRHIPAAKAAYIRLFINGESWGLYPQVQQMNGDYIEEWFFGNDGARWRADRPEDAIVGPGGPGPGGMWGDGTAALNDLGPDTTEYQQYYTLKSSDIENPWDKLVRVCDVLNNTPLDSLEANIRPILDLDRTLWFLASEIAFSDDDSYVYKGKMDYYLYWDPETDRITPLEYDGNSVMLNNNANWNPFYNANKVNYPLLNRLLAVPSIRQRYLAHFRTILQDALNPALTNPLIDQYDAIINADVQADTKKLYSFTQYNSNKTILRNFILNHRNTLLTDTEMGATGPAISNCNMHSGAGTWANPLANESATVTTNVASSNNIQAVFVYYSEKAYGNFSKTQMFDDGQHNDGANSDGVFGAQLPGFDAGSLVRFYVEAVAGNSAGTRTYLPAGAEHDVFYFGIDATASASPVVINEIMASNSVTASDENGEFEDWIELYNPGTETVDLSGFFLTDNPANLNKWAFPAGTSIAAHTYLIIWADEDQEQGPLHTNFKLSASGEILYLLDSSLQWVDTLNFQEQITDMGYARVPNGSGPFVIQSPTFNASNDVTSTASPEEQIREISVAPNPVAGQMNIRTRNLAPDTRLMIRDAAGRLLLETTAMPYQEINVASWPTGLYLISAGHLTEKIIVRPDK